MNQWKGIFGILALVCGILAVTMSANAGDGGVPLPHLSKATDGENCVEPVDVMRRQHMVFLQHQRDDTLREGIRGQKHSLNGCIDCHATAAVPVQSAIDGMHRLVAGEGREKRREYRNFPDLTLR